MEKLNIVIPEPASWNLDAYESMLRDMVNAGFSFKTDWATPQCGAREVYLRHDVDFSLPLAVSMAQSEARMGVSSTFFIEVSGVLYNAFSSDNQDSIRAIHGCGHRIGAHLIFSRSADAPSLREQAIFQLRLLDALPVPVERSIASIHQPDNLVGCAESVTGIPHTYDTAHFNKDHYFADSGGKWGCNPDDWLSAVGRGGGMNQLLIHPLWWTVTGESPRKKLESFTDAVMSTVENDLRQLSAWRGLEVGVE